MSWSFRHVPLRSRLARPKSEVAGVYTLATTSKQPSQRRATGEPGNPGPTYAFAADMFAEPPRIAVYSDPVSAPLVVPVSNLPSSEAEVPDFIEAIANHAYSLARDQGGQLPLLVFRELVDNLVHASFQEVVITILNSGNTVRISDRGPGIADKDAALRAGFTSADSRAKQFIRGVGSGFAVVREALAPMNGALVIEDNLGHGTVVTARVETPEENVLAPPAVPNYNLSERQLKALLLTMELSPVGPTRIAHELGVSTSTAYRDLVSLEEAGFVSSLATGHRSVTEEGLAYLGALL
jgi:anti-sigma regulatory factor (Ser/Thr protein kinase)